MGDATTVADGMRPIFRPRRPRILGYVRSSALDIASSSAGGSGASAGGGGGGADRLLTIDASNPNILASALR